MRGGWKKRFERLATAADYASWLARAAATRAADRQDPRADHLSAARRQHDRARDDQARSQVEGAAEARRIPRLREPRAGRQGCAAWRRQGSSAKDRARTCRPRSATRWRQPDRDRATSACTSSATIRSLSASGCASIARARQDRSSRDRAASSTATAATRSSCAATARSAPLFNHVFPDNSIEIETTRPLDPGGWHHLALTYDGSSRARGLQLFFDGQLDDTRIVVDNLQQSILKSGDKKNESWVRQPAVADWPPPRRDAAGRVG